LGLNGGGQVPTLGVDFLSRGPWIGIPASQPSRSSNFFLINPLAELMLDLLKPEPLGL
jgi:hypothetical protein